MRPARLRFTIGSIMVATVVVAVVSWIVAGLVRHGKAWFSQAPLYVLIAYPFLFAACGTLFVTIVQFRSDRRRARAARTGEQAPRRRT
jgi:hypothetical protein